MATNVPIETKNICHSDYKDECERLSTHSCLAGILRFIKTKITRLYLSRSSLDRGHKIPSIN